MAGGNKSNSAKTKKRKLQERVNQAVKRDAERAKRSTAFRSGGSSGGYASRSGEGGPPAGGEERR